MSDPDQMTAEQQRAFLAWRDLANRAAETKTAEDALASGKAFARFHYLFVEKPFRPTGKVIAFPRRHPDFGGAA